MTEIKDELEQLLEREMRLYIGCSGFAIPDEVYRRPIANCRYVLLRYPSAEDAIAFYEKYKQYSDTRFVSPVQTTIQQTNARARSVGADAVMVVRGDGSIIDWWSVNGH